MRGLCIDMTRVGQTVSLPKGEVNLRFADGIIEGDLGDEMVSDVIPVVPYNVRPNVPLQEGEYATIDLNILYKRLSITIGLNVSLNSTRRQA
jgi:DNA-directed RNA polymerase beta' subunit